MILVIVSFPLQFIVMERYSIHFDSQHGCLINRIIQQKVNS